MSILDISAPHTRSMVRPKGVSGTIAPGSRPANIANVEEKLAQLWPPYDLAGEEPCPDCGQKLEHGQLVTSDFKRHISCPQVPAFRTAA